MMPVDLFGLAADLEGDWRHRARAATCCWSRTRPAPWARPSGAKMCGSFGDASVISFHPRKIVTTGEGGMVLTDHADLADRVRMLRNHGIDVSGGSVGVRRGRLQPEDDRDRGLPGGRPDGRVEDLIAAAAARGRAIYDRLLDGTLRRSRPRRSPRAASIPTRLTWCWSTPRSTGTA